MMGVKYTQPYDSAVHNCYSRVPGILGFNPDQVPKGGRRSIQLNPKYVEFIKICSCLYPKHWNITL